MGQLDGKTGIVFGVANKRSIAWAIAQVLAREGMRLAFTYQGERLKESVEALTSASMPGALPGATPTHASRPTARPPGLKSSASSTSS